MIDPNDPVEDPAPEADDADDPEPSVEEPAAA
jgi:hypothetical protein